VVSVGSAAAREGVLKAGQATGACTRAGFCVSDGGKDRLGSGEASRGGGEVKGFNMEWDWVSLSDSALVRLPTPPTDTPDGG
jgi:hypothetical protein